MRVITVQFRKIFTSAGFYISVPVTVILLFCAQIYADAMTND